MSDRRFTPLQWPEPRTIYLTIDFECDYGTALSTNSYGAIDDVASLTAILEEYDVPLTCFVQTEVLSIRPESVEQLRQCDVPVRFHTHSHTHRPRDETTTKYEVETSTERYRDFFGRSPSGYRFPNGNIRPRDYEILSNHGYSFSASVFPTWRPGHFNNTAHPTEPVRIDHHSILEIPFTIYSSVLRVPTALSYCRLLGRSFTRLLTGRPPSVVTFNLHMHDLVTPSSYQDLSVPYQLVYRRNDRGLEILRDVIERFQANEYTFDVLDTLVDRLPHD